MRPDVLWVEFDELVEIHEQQIKKHGGTPGIKELSLIESAMARPQNRATYSEPDLAELAAAYAFGLTKNHGFNDGNKRAAWMAARLFLALNHYTLLATDDESVDWMLRLTAGELSEDELAAIFRDRIR